MIKINLIAEKKQAKGKTSSISSGPAFGGAQNLILVLVVLLGVGVAGGWWWSLTAEKAEWERKHVEADKELERLAEIRKKGEEYKRQKELLQRKITLITDLKKQQDVPVHILDQVSKNLPDFLWLESMSAKNNAINITGKATNYNAVSNFYDNLNDAGFFKDVALGRTSQGKESVAFSLSAKFIRSPSNAPEAEAKKQSPEDVVATQG